MTLDWQSIATLVLVAAATGYVLRTLWRTLRSNKGGGSCGTGCGSCGAAKDIVTIEVIKRPTP